MAAWSISVCLAHLARGQGRAYEERLKYYGDERILYPLGKSRHTDRFVLKGVPQFQVWGVSGCRPTRDIELLGKTNNRIGTVVQIVREICMQAVLPSRFLGVCPTEVWSPQVRQQTIDDKRVCSLGCDKALDQCMLANVHQATVC